MSKLSSATVTFIEWVRISGRHHRMARSLIVSFASIGGLMASIMLKLALRTSSSAGSDMKTLYASGWCFAHGQNAYAIANVQSVFAANGVVFPSSWFAHAPVYPPTTLAFLAPLTVFPMIVSINCVAILSSTIFAFALASLMNEAARRNCSVWLQVGMAAACAACPLLSFALSMVNVSVAASGLCILAFLERKYWSSWTCAWFLAIAVVLKPHLAIWMILGMLLIPETAMKRIALRASAIFGCFAACTGLWLSVSGHLRLQLNGLFQILHSETATGSSMSPSSHEVVPVFAQITSIHTLPGFWQNDSSSQSAFVFVLLVLLGTFVGRRLWTTSEDHNLPAMGAWLAFGLLATYHRAHDALILLLILPWMMEQLRRTPRSVRLWMIAGLYAAMNFSWPLDFLRANAVGDELHHIVTFLLLRQAALADLGLTLLLVGIPGIVYRQRKLTEKRFAGSPKAVPSSV